MVIVVEIHDDPIVCPAEFVRPRGIGEQHGKMPYFQVPLEVLEDVHSLHAWARISIEIAHASKKK